MSHPSPHHQPPTARPTTAVHQPFPHIAGTLVALVLLSMVVVLVACGGSGSASPTSPVTSAPAVSTTIATREDRLPSGTERPSAASPGPAVLRTTSDLVLHERADSTSPTRTVPAQTSFGSPTALLITDQVEGWYEVLIPGRPTGATGWVPVGAGEVRSVKTEIHIDLDARTLRLIDGGELIFESPIAIGAGDTPTPTGRFSVTDKLQSPNPDGAYGPFAIGLSGRSEVLTEFAGGDGQIGIHGTSDPATIGQAVSHGCVRVPNDIAEQLNSLVPLGTPVLIS